MEDMMTLRDTLEIGLKKDAEFRKDNLPEDQVRGPEVPAGPGRSPVIPAAKADAARAAKAHVRDEKAEDDEAEYAPEHPRTDAGDSDPPR